jgi:broad specificity phosphatase PhoE
MLRDPRHLGRKPTKEDVEESQNVRDPSLTEFGQRACLWYRGVLPHRLREIGIDSRKCGLGCSRLLRAQQTAEDLFPAKDLVIFSCLGENGHVPENTPRGMQYQPPSWEGFLEELRSFALREGVRDFVVVAHGSFIKRSISDILGEEIPPLSNLDGYALELSSRADGSLASNGKISSVPFPQRAYESEGEKEEATPGPSVLRGWRLLVSGLHPGTF